MDFNVIVIFGAVGVFSLLNLIVLSIVRLFNGMTFVDAIARAFAGGVCVTGILVILIALYVAGHNLMTVPSPGFPFSVVLILCLLMLAIICVPAIICVWLSTKWLLRPVRRREP